MALVRCLEALPEHCPRAVQSVAEWVCLLVVRVVRFQGLRLVFLVGMACRRTALVVRRHRQRLRRVLLADLACLLVVLAGRLLLGLRPACLARVDLVERVVVFLLVMDCLAAQRLPLVRRLLLHQVVRAMDCLEVLPRLRPVLGDLLLVGLVMVCLEVRRLLLLDLVLSLVSLDMAWVAARLRRRLARFLEAARCRVALVMACLLVVQTRLRRWLLRGLARRFRRPVRVDLLLEARAMACHRVDLVHRRLAACLVPVAGSVQMV